jgi:hypothetical protein
MIFGGFFAFWFFLVFALILIPLGFTVWALIDVVRAPDAAFGPPWDNAKGMWILGMALGFVVPMGTVVAPILWWTQVRPALRAGQPVPRPFWAPRPSYPPQYPAPYPPQAYPQPPQVPLPPD